MRIGGKRVGSKTKKGKIKEIKRERGIVELDVSKLKLSKDDLTAKRRTLEILGINKPSALIDAIVTSIATGKWTAGNMNMHLRTIEERILQANNPEQLEEFQQFMRTLKRKSPAMVLNIIKNNAMKKIRRFKKK